ncbi:recombinase family protein [Phenylobacterium sp.]|uniref:recombinase family protein n=1 Tax=Phenylobacterium sp. TaxID=1871053 RepID=UPI002723F3DF|nr:recombinase family protein [Phenylobacterium sp.]MDO8378259.1 recombinase family protein [Phenylobacterium sp.]
MFAEHQRRKTVARILNERGYRTRIGAKFSDMTIRRLIEDPTAKGTHRANWTQQAEGPVRRFERKPEEEWIWNEVEAVVSVDLWDRCNAILAMQAAGRKPAKKTSYLFSGLAHCHCGPKMYVPARRNKYVCPTCHNKIPVDDLEAVFQSQLEGFALSPDELAAHDEAANEALREKERLLDGIETDLRKLANSENELFELYHAGALSKADFGRRHQPISERRTQLEDELPRLQAERDILKINRLSQEEVLAEAGNLLGKWPDFTFEQRRQIVETICDRIVIGKEGVEISLLQDPFGNSDEMATPPLRLVALRRSTSPTSACGLGEDLTARLATSPKSPYMARP